MTVHYCAQGTGSRPTGHGAATAPHRPPAQDKTRRTHTHAKSPGWGRERRKAKGDGWRDAPCPCRARRPAPAQAPERRAGRSWGYVGENCIECGGAPCSQPASRRVWWWWRRRRCLRNMPSGRLAGCLSTQPDKRREAHGARAGSARDGRRHILAIRPCWDPAPPRSRGLRVPPTRPPTACTPPPPLCIWAGPACMVCGNGTPAPSRRRGLYKDLDLDHVGKRARAGASGGQGQQRGPPALLPPNTRAAGWLAGWLQGAGPPAPAGGRASHPLRTQLERPGRHTALHLRTTTTLPSSCWPRAHASAGKSAAAARWGGHREGKEIQNRRRDGIFIEGRAIERPARTMRREGKQDTCAPRLCYSMKWEWNLMCEHGWRGWAGGMSGKEVERVDLCPPAHRRRDWLSRAASSMAVVASLGPGAKRR